MFRDFALCYLARYNSEAIQPRVLTAFRNAWAINNVTMFPRVVGGHPGFLMADIQYEWGTEIIIAIEGMTSLSQIDRLASWFGAGISPGNPKAVWPVFLTYAQEILARLDGNLIWQASKQPPTQVTFCGFSLGSAIADVMGDLFHTQFPLGVHRITRFAPPKVGPARYYATRERGLSRVTVTHVNDPIQYIPENTCSIAWGGVGQVHNFYLRFLQDPDIEKLDYLGDVASGRETTFNWSVPQIYRYAISAPGGENFWLNHSMDAYRLMFMNGAENSHDLLRIRFNRLEFNDENNWQHDFRPGQLNTAILPKMLTVSGSDPYVIPGPAEAQLIAVGVPQPPLPPEADTGLSGGGEWGVPEQAQAVIFRRQLRRPTVQTVP